MLDGLHYGFTVRVLPGFVEVYASVIRVSTGI